MIDVYPRVLSAGQDSSGTIIPFNVDSNGNLYVIEVAPSGTVKTENVDIVAQSYSPLNVSIPTSSTVQVGSIDGLTISGGTIGVETEWSTTSTIPITSQFIDSAGTLYDQTLVDTSQRLILAPTSTVQAVSAPGTGSTVEVGNWPATQDVNLVNDSGTIQIGNWVTDYIKTTGGTVEIGDKTGFELSTTSTVPVSFSTPVSVTATDLDIRDLSSATDSVSIPTSSTVQVGSIDGLTISGGTIGVETEWSTTSTIPITSQFIDSAGTLYDQTLVDTSQRLILAPTSTVQAVSAPGTGSTVEVGNWPATQDVNLVNDSGTIQIGNWVTDYIKTTGGTVEIGDKTGFELSTTSTVPVSFSTPVSVETTTSTIPEVTNIGSTVDIKHVDSAIAVPSDLQANYYTSSIVVSSATNVDTGSTVDSGDIYIGDYVTKTISVYASTAASTITIKVSPSGTNTYYTYFTEGTVPADSLYTRSFTEAFEYMKVVFTGGTTASTLELLSVGLQTG